MHVHRHHVGPQQVVVDRRDLDAARQQPLHHRIDLVLGEHEVAHRHRSVSHGHESDPAAQRQGGLDGHAVDHDLEVGARQAEAVDTAGSGRRQRASEGRRHLVPVDVGCTGNGTAEEDAGNKCQCPSDEFCHGRLLLLRRGAHPLPRCLTQFYGIGRTTHRWGKPPKPNVTPARTSLSGWSSIRPPRRPTSKATLSRTCQIAPTSTEPVSDPPKSRS